MSEESQEGNEIFIICLIGDKNVGKTSLISRILDNSFTNETENVFSSLFFKNFCFKNPRSYDDRYFIMTKKRKYI